MNVQRLEIEEFMPIIFPKALSNLHRGLYPYAPEASLSGDTPKGYEL